ncbi:hypothetical protein AB0B28_02105 [Glycomyces sp. NPDC046736]|uniref:hypothetical protein n=1 Tax=Glycomyces sp. NPDC046736 TaxID=3155615 RepID=UPI0033F49541
MTFDLRPVNGFRGWDEYREALRAVDRLVEGGALQPIPAGGPEAAYSDLYHFEGPAGEVWCLEEPEPPARGSLFRLDAASGQGSDWDVVGGLRPVTGFRSWGRYLRFLTWLERATAATELVPADLDADLTAYGSVHEFVTRDGTPWELHVPNPGADDFGSFSRLA